MEEIIPITFPATRIFLQAIPNPNKKIFTTTTYDLASLENAARRVLASWQILRSIAIDTGDKGQPPLLLLLASSDAYFSQAVTRLPDVRDNDQIETIELKGDHWKGEVPRGLLCRMAVARATETGTCALVFTINHAVLDELSSRRIDADIVSSLSGGTMCEKVRWSLFANPYRCYMSSLPAQEAIVTHLARLRGIAQRRASIWPQVAEPKKTANPLTTPVSPTSSSSNNNNSKAQEAVECRALLSPTRRPEPSHLYITHTKPTPSGLQ